ncbi:MAG: hypothetical protein F6K40_28045 [Okeania sp. SIO3I5]|uniref:hypothetical protein n=1 Tax=Okeania sp. SIO3I5 TaxID=2607805 RepID=UPI0013BBBCFB|nr:hypothetical protein [Okeania sp. SIO3I5]NEQ39893.1 hypothetical protein [Okeania sp. SIO3I5]
MASKSLGAWVWRPNPYSFGSGAFYGLCIFIIFGAEAQQWEHLAPVPPTQNPRCLGLKTKPLQFW